MADIYKLGIEIALTGSGMAGLQALSRLLTGVHSQALAVNGVFSRWGAAIAGAGSVLAGSAILGGLVKIADHGEKLIHQQNALVRAGLSYNDVLRLTGQAFDDITKKVPTAAADQVLRSINELRSVTGSLDEAVKIAPFSLKLEAILKNITGADAEGAGFQIWRALEMKGITTSDPELAGRLANAMAQIIAGSAGKVTAATYQAMAKRGGAAWIHATPEAVAGPYSVAAADLGGDTAGTALMTLSNLLTGATMMSRQQLAVMQDAGIIDMSKVHKIPGSASMNIEPGAVKDSLQDAGNIFKWVQDIAPNLHKLAATMAAQNGQSESANFDSLLAKLGRNRNAIRMLTMFSDPGFVDQINKDIAIWGQTMPLNAAYDTMLGRTSPPRSPTEAADQAGPGAGGAVRRQADYTAVMAAFQKQWESLMEAVGGPVARAAIPIMQSLTDTFSSLGSWANANPETITIIGKAAAALGFALVGLGGAAVVGAAMMLIPGGAVAMAIGGIGLAITAMAALNWSAVSSGLDAIKGALASFISWLQSFVPSFSALPGFAPSGASSIPPAFVPGGLPYRGPQSFYTPPPLDPGLLERARRSDAESRRDPEAARGRARLEHDRTVPLNIKTSVYLDGHILAETISSELARLSTFPRQAPQGDSYVGWAAPDYNFATG